MIYFERKEYLNKLISAEGNRMIKIITGIRRCGKFFLLFNCYMNFFRFFVNLGGNISSISVCIK